jgi:formylmethanofuran dehydrogenase subunit E
LRRTRLVLLVSGLLALHLTGLDAPSVAQKAGTGADNKEISRFLERFHGHTCPGSLMGLRLGMAAKEALKGSGKLKAKCFMLSCPVDGIQVGAGTTYGNKALEVEDRNELRLILTDVTSGRQVEARLTQRAEEMGKTYRDLSNQGRSCPPGSPDRLRIEKEMGAVLEWFRTAPDAEVVTIRSLGQ